MNFCIVLLLLKSQVDSASRSWLSCLVASIVTAHKMMLLRGWQTHWWIVESANKERHTTNMRLISLENAYIIPHWMDG